MPTENDPNEPVMDTGEAPSDVTSEAAGTVDAPTPPVDAPSPAPLEAARTANAAAPWKEALKGIGKPAPRGPDSPAPWTEKLAELKGTAPVPDPPARITFSDDVVAALNLIPKLTSLRAVEEWVDAYPEAASLCGMLPSFTRFPPDSMPSPDTLICCDDEVMVLFRRGPDGRFTKSRLSR